jgi:leucyl aminopeptidase
VEGAIVADFDPGRYKTEGRADDKHIGAFHVAAPVTAETRAALDRGRIIGESQNFTRDLVNEPGNYMTPTMLADRAVAMAKEVGLEYEVLDKARCEELKMGLFLSVALGSEEPPKFIHLKYNPEVNPKVAITDRVLGLVGKGITFDTGGHLHQTCRSNGSDEIRHGRRRGDARRDARHRIVEAALAGAMFRADHRKHARR